MGDVIKGNAILLVRGKTSIPEPRKKWGDETTYAILKGAVRFLEIDSEIKRWAEDGVKPWELPE